MASAILRQMIIQPQTQFLSAKPHPTISFIATTPLNPNHHNEFPTLFSSLSGHRNLPVPVRSSSGKDGVVSSADDEEGVSLGTMKLSRDINIPRFETLLFQWANSLNQGAQMPLPCPIKSTNEVLIQWLRLKL
uniref:DUF7148 domain-containing protein n=1 Tax=Opuntia streptacantha TaxID=393608 RepID=A0A7C8YU19_OPUST